MRPASRSQDPIREFTKLVCLFNNITIILAESEIASHQIMDYESHPSILHLHARPHCTHADPTGQASRSPYKHRDAPCVIWHVSIFSHLFPQPGFMKDRTSQRLHRSTRRRSCDSTDLALNKIAKPRDALGRPFLTGRSSLFARKCITRRPLPRAKSRKSMQT